MNRFWPISLIFILILASCKQESINCGVSCTYDEELIFQTGFDGTVIENGEHSRATFSGADLSLTDHNSWEGLEAHANIGNVQITYEDGDIDQRFADIVNDPENEANSVMRFAIREPHIREGTKKKGRVQLNLSQNNCVKEIYQTIRLRFHPDMAHLKEWEERVYWLSIFEFWNNADWTKEKYPFRVTVNLYKDESGPVKEMYFHAKGDSKKNCKNCKWHDEWTEEADHFPIPFGEWMDIELYIKEGDENNGRFYMAVTPEGGDKVVLFNITNTTQHPKENCADGFTHLQPLKLYTSDKLIEYMSDADKKLEIYWDDWKFYKNKTF